MLDPKRALHDAANQSLGQVVIALSLSREQCTEL